MLWLRISVNREGMEPQFSLIILLKNFLSQKELWMIMELNIKSTWIWDKHVISGKLGILKGIVPFRCWNTLEMVQKHCWDQSKVISNDFHYYTASVTTFSLSQGFLTFLPWTLLTFLWSLWITSRFRCKTIKCSVRNQLYLK